MQTKQSSDARRLGTVLALGVVAGFGARYVLARASRSIPGVQNRMIDWNQARKLALRVSQWEQAPVRDRAARREQYERMVAQSVPLISRYMNVELPQPISRLYVVDRRDWLLANFESFEQLFKPIEELYLELSEQRNTSGSALSQINSKVVGAQMGALVGFLARRVLGQYDLSLLSPDTSNQGALYFVEPNIARVQTQLGLSDEDFRLWIALHETTHVFQFEAFPWVRPYFNELLSQFIGQVSNQLSGMGTNLSQLVGRFVNGKADKHWIEKMLSPEQQQIFDRMQALMSLVEGYSNHIMNAIGEELLPSFGDIEHRIQQRQQGRPLLEELFNRVTGMDLKLAQYQQGEIFVNAVVAARGVPFVNQVWHSPDNLPTMSEIRNPEQWIARIDSRTVVEQR